MGGFYRKRDSFIHNRDCLFFLLNLCVLLETYCGFFNELQWLDDCREYFTTTLYVSLVKKHLEA